MTWGLARFVASFRPSATGFPSSFLSKRPRHIVGLAPITDPRLSDDGLRQAETRHRLQMQMLMIQREIHGQMERKMRGQRRSKAALTFEAEMRRITHSILAGGE